jgi:hypothetical protein
MLRRLIAGIRATTAPARHSPDPVAEEDAAARLAARAGLRQWILNDRLPAFSQEELYASPTRARAAEYMATPGGDARAEPLLRGLLQGRDSAAVDRLLLAELLIRRGDEAGALALLDNISADSARMRGRAAIIKGQFAFESGDFAAARHWADQALADAPDAVSIRVLHGSLLEMEGKRAEAEAQYRIAMAYRPDDFVSRLYLALLLLHQERMVEGFLEWVGAETLGNIQRAASQVPMWDGRPLGGDAVLVTSSNGIGDIIQLLRFAPWLRRAAPQARLTLQVRPELLSLAQALRVFDEVSAQASPEERRFDWHVSLFHLALFHFVDPHPPALPDRYLECDPGKVAAMREILQATPGAAQPRTLRVGIRWSGEPSPYDQKRSIPIALLEPLMRLPGVTWVALLEHGNAALPGLRESDAPFIDLSGHLTDLADTAALISNLDLVVCVDTSLVHLSGALGKPTWLMARPDPNWRWGITGGETPWYASVRVFRHPGRLDWSHVIANVAAALTERCRSAGISTAE